MKKKHHVETNHSLYGSVELVKKGYINPGVFLFIYILLFNLVFEDITNNLKFLYFCSFGSTTDLRKEKDFQKMVLLYNNNNKIL